MSDPSFHARHTAFCQRFAEQFPLPYRLTVRLLLAAGNLLLAALTAVLLLPVFWLFRLLVGTAQSGDVAVFSVLACFSVYCLASVLTALPVRNAPPQGIRLKPHDAPELFALLDRNAKRSGSLKIRHVRINGEYGLSSNQRRFFGFSVRDTLYIGLPLLQCIGREHFDALVAYQTAHLAEGYSGSNDEIWQHRRRWEQIGEVGRNNPYLGLLYAPFFRYWLPFFEVWIHALSRQQVLAADRAAARQVSDRLYAAALCGLHTYGHYFDCRFWETFWEEAEHRPEPSVFPFTRLPHDFRRFCAEHRQTLYGDFRRLLDTPAYTGDTHPTLAWRLDALDTVPLLPADDGETAVSLLGNAAETLIRQNNRTWWQQSAESWQQRYREVQTLRERHAELEAAAQNGELSAEDALEHARLTEWPIGRPDDACRLLALCLERFPDNDRARYHYGRLLLEAGNADGTGFVETAARNNPVYRLPAALAQAKYHDAQGRSEAAEHFRAEAAKTEYELEMAEQECQNWQVRDTLLPPDLDDPQLRLALDRILPLLDKADAVYLAKRPLQHNPYQQYILGYRLRTALSIKTRRKDLDRITEQLLQIDTPYPFLFIRFTANNRPFQNALRQTENSRIR